MTLGRLMVCHVMYSWGVLHHTEAIWRAMENALVPLASGGTLRIALYNDRDGKSEVWGRVKRIYCSGALGRFAVSSLFVPYSVLAGLRTDLRELKSPLDRYIQYKRSRGMSVIHDWLGGYPFEVASRGGGLRVLRAARTLSRTPTPQRRQRLQSVRVPPSMTRPVAPAPCAA